MASVIQSLNASSSSGIGWTIGRPILVAALMTILTPAFAMFVFEPFHRRVLRSRVPRWGPYAQLTVLVLLACAFCSVASYAGTSILYGAYLSGTVMAHADASFHETVNTKRSPTTVQNVEHSGESNAGSSLPSFHKTYELFVAPIQRPLLEPLFFASIGFAIPFLSLWDPKPLWRGIVYSLLMLFGKVIVGIWLLIWTSASLPLRSLRSLILNATHHKSIRSPAPANRSIEVSPTRGLGEDKATLPSALLVGAAMVARGEIGLIILQIGYNTSGKLSEESFVVGNWAVVLNTIVGPVTVGVIVRMWQSRIMKGAWGVQK
jgi:Kef-type K+ transport system membrane component KefB